MLACLFILKPTEDQLNNNATLFDSSFLSMNSSYSQNVVVYGYMWDVNSVFKTWQGPKSFLINCYINTTWEPCCYEQHEVSPLKPVAQGGTKLSSLA